MALSPDQAINVNENGAGGGGRTHTERKLHGILSPVRLEEVVKHCLAKDPDERWQGRTPGEGEHRERIQANPGWVDDNRHRAKEELQRLVPPRNPELSTLFGVSQNPLREQLTRPAEVVWCPKNL